MFEKPRRAKQARDFTTNVPKILDLKSSSEQMFSENWRWVPLNSLLHLSYIEKWLYYIGKMKQTIFSKLRGHIKDNNNSPHGEFHRFLFPFSRKFPDLNFAPYVLYIYSCYETRTWHKQWAWVTCDQKKVHARFQYSWRELKGKSSFKSQ